MRKVATFGLACLALTSIVFSGCEKDDDDSKEEDASLVVASNVELSSTNIATVDAVVWKEFDSNPTTKQHIIATEKYMDKGFKMQLPKSLEPKLLSLLSNDIPDNITISDKTAQYTEISFEVSDKNNLQIGELFKADNFEADNMMFYLYVDKNVTIKGEAMYYDEDSPEEVVVSKYDLKLKKGWNYVYTSITESDDLKNEKVITTRILQTQKPTKINFKWFYESYRE